MPVLASRRAHYDRTAVDWRCLDAPRSNQPDDTIEIATKQDIASTADDEPRHAPKSWLPGEAHGVFLVFEDGQVSGFSGYS